MTRPFRVCNVEEDEWLKAAGFDPTLHPAKVSVGSFIEDHYGYLVETDERYACIGEALEHLRLVGMAQLERRYTLEERFKLYGVEVVEVLGGDDYGPESGPLTIRLSNGLTLREVYNPIPSYNIDVIDERY